MKFGFFIWVLATALLTDVMLLLLLWSCRDFVFHYFYFFVFFVLFCFLFCLSCFFLSRLLPAEKLDEMLAGGQQEVVLRGRPSDDFRAATVKQRPTSRRITQAEINVRLPATLLRLIVSAIWRVLKVVKYPNIRCVLMTVRDVISEDLKMDNSAFKGEVCAYSHSQWFPA